MKYFLLLAVLCSTLPAWADDSATIDGATNVRLNQRSASSPYRRADVNIKGSDYLWHAIGFNGSGTLTAIDLWDMVPSGGDALQVLRINAAGTALEFADVESSGTGVTDGDKGDISISASGGTYLVDASTITSAKITDNTIANADISTSAAIALSKLATDPLARANHTGTQAWSTLTGTPTTLSGYGVTDATPFDFDLDAIAGLSTTAYGRGLLISADATALRATAGLVLGTDIHAYDEDIADLADGSLTGTKVAFADTDSNFSATTIQAAVEELDDVNGSGPNAADGKVEWSQIVGIPAGIADGTDDGSGGGSGTMAVTQEGGVQVGGSDIVTLNFGAGFDLAESPDTKINLTLDGSEVFTGGDLSWSTNTPTIGANAVALGTDTTGNYIATIADSGASELTFTGSGEGAAVTAAIASSIARDSEVAAGYQPLDADLSAMSALTTTSYGRGLLDDADAAAARASLVVGTGLGGTAAVGITTNPLSVTWTNETYVLYYGATGTIVLPVASDYTRRTLIIISTGTYTITVDPTGSEVIYETGASLGAGVADVLTATAGLSYGYFSDGARWTKFEASGGGAGSSAWGDITGTPTTLSGYGITDAQGLDADLTDLADGVLSGSKVNVTTGTFSGAGTYAAQTRWVGTLSSGPAALTLPLSAGETVEFDLAVTGGPHTLTFAASSRVGYSGGTITSLALPTGRQRLSFYNNGTNVVLTDSVAEALSLTADVSGTLPVANGGTGITSLGTGVATWMGTPSSANLAAAVTGETGTGALVFAGGNIADATATTPSAADNDTSVATTAFVQTELDGTKTGSHASPYTTASATSPTWSGQFHAVYMGVAQTVNLPAAASYEGRGIIIYNTGSFIVTVDANGSEVLVRDGTAQTGGVNLTLSAGAGNYVSFISDGTRWISLGYKGTLAVGS